MLVFQAAFSSPTLKQATEHEKFGEISKEYKILKHSMKQLERVGLSLISSGDYRRYCIQDIQETIGRFQNKQQTEQYTHTQRALKMSKKLSRRSRR